MLFSSQSLDRVELEVLTVGQRCMRGTGARKTGVATSASSGGFCSILTPLLVCEITTISNSKDMSMSRATYRSIGSIGGSGFSFLRILLVLLGSKTFRQHSVKVIIVVPEVEGVKLLLGFGFGLCSDLELEAVGKMGLGGDVGKKVGDVGELGSLWAQRAFQFDGGVVFCCFRHVDNDCT